MDAGQIMSHAPTTTSQSTHLNPTSNSQKRYSFLDRLENLSLTSPELTTFAPPPAPPRRLDDRRVDDETIRRLSTSLQNLLSQKHGDNHLPELPVPTYDNGNVDVVAVRSGSRGSPATSLEIAPESTEVNHRPRSVIPNPAVVPSRTVPRFKHQSLQKQVLKRTSDVPADHEKLYSARSVPQLTRTRTTTESPRASCYGSNVREGRPSRSGSSRASRPTSTYSAATVTRAKMPSRPEPTLPQTTYAPHHKKSTSYHEQRFHSNPTSALNTNPIDRPESPKSQPRRRFRLIPSFKDLNTHARTQIKQSTVEVPATIQDSPDSTSSQLISLHDALRGSVVPLSPLHDPHHDQKFTLECKEMLDLKPDSRGRSSRKRLVPRLNSVPQDADNVPNNNPMPSKRHGSTASEALTVGTSIFDLDWPQPSTYTTLTPEVYQRQKAAVTRRSAPPNSGYDTKQIMVPSPPPTYPLPPVPTHRSASVKRQPSRRSPTRKSVDTSITLASMNQTIATRSPSTSRRTNRVTALAASKGLQVDANLNTDGSNGLEYLQDSATTPEPSPLNARFLQSKRNSRVHELKKKHLSMLVKDTPVPSHGEIKPQGPTRPESYPSDLPKPIYSPGKMPNQRISSSIIDKRKQLHMLPGPARYADGSHDPASVIKANIGKSRHAKPTGSTSQKSGHQIGEQVFGRPLGHSGVMVMVDSSPQKTREFRAGAIKVTTPPRRKSSINKAQISASLRYQPELRKNSLPIISSLGGQGMPSMRVAGSLAPPPLAPGMQSPSKASSILEPTPVKIPRRGREVGQYHTFPEVPHTPIRQVMESQESRLRSPSTRRRRFGPTNSASRQEELDRLHAEIDRMVRVRQDMKTKREYRARPKLSFTDRYENEKMPTSRLPSLSKKSPRSMLSRFELASGSLRSSTSATKHLHIYDDSDMSITPKSSFQSTSSESSRGFQRKNSDSSLTDPTECDDMPSTAKSSGRLFIMPSPSPPDDDCVADTTYIKSKKYSNMPNQTSLVQPTGSWFDYIMNHQLLVPPLRVSSSSTQKTKKSPRPSDDIELDHFLTEADQMDDAIDSFQQSQYRSTSPVQLAAGTTMRSLLSQDNRRSAVSGVVDLQRIQDQVNGRKEFGRISLITRPRTT